ncbi:uncharacterized protein LOC118750438 [Rhagoletis pomonella]|uniref:uncharacterized protein LOC118750438 n=1 Tax=Rhagoletis pomonella TaxID=28610 RepID=UPI001780F1E5|nr:uncharacterized protein LOC118750438 [Rhagoletis pomonella]
MAKTTNKTQLELLVQLMDSQPGIARGFFKGGKEELAKFWRSAEIKLNSAGPPMKTVAEWKKVHKGTDLLHISIKFLLQVAQNVRARTGTGGGPNTEKTFTATEEAIYKLISMKESVEGIVVPKFGLQAEQAELTIDSDEMDVHEIELANTTLKIAYCDLFMSKKKKN